MESEVKQKVSSLEQNLDRFILSVNEILYRMSQDTERLSHKMEDADERMEKFQRFIEADIAELQRDRRKMNRQWGDLANRLGTFAEDVAAPNLPRIAKELFDEQEEHFKAFRFEVRSQVDNKIYEFDGIIETENKVFLLETKVNARPEYASAMPTLIQHFYECFPQYQSKQLIPIFASMSIPDNVVTQLTSLGVYAMAMGDDNMDLLNFEAVQSRM